MTGYSLNDKAEAEMNTRGFEYGLQYSHLSRTVGAEVLNELVAEGKLAAVIKNVMSQRLNGLPPENYLDDSQFGLTEEQLSKAAAHRAQRDARLNGLASEIEQSANAALDIEEEGHGRSTTVGKIQPRAAAQPVGRVNDTGNGAAQGR